MKVRAIKTQIGDYGKKYPGDEFTVTASYGKELISKGRVEEIEEDSKDKAAKEKKEVDIKNEKVEILNLGKEKNEDKS
jgi:hypothetical protein